VVAAIHSHQSLLEVHPRLEGLDSETSKIDDAWLLLAKGVYSTGSGNLILPNLMSLSVGKGTV
jgi:hypothetical protein